MLQRRRSRRDRRRSCARHPQVWVFADEIYSRLAYAGPFDTLATRPGMLERTIICDGASKTWAMTGWRIGFAANRALAPVFTRWITNTDSCASQISQWAAVEAVTGPQDAADAMRASFLERRDLIVGLLNTVPGITCKVPGGAFYAWPNVTEACAITGLRRFGGVPQAVARRKRAWQCSPTSISAGACPARASTSGFRTRRRPRRSATASRGSTRSCERIRRRRAGPWSGRRRRDRRNAHADGPRLELRRARRDPRTRPQGARRERRSVRAPRPMPRRYVASHAQGPRPAMPPDLVTRFMQRATDMQSTVERIADRSGIPAAVARYLDALVLPPPLAHAEGASRRLLAGVRRSRLERRRPRHRGASHGWPRSPRDHGSVLRDRRDGDAGRARGRRHADRDDACCRTRTSRSCAPIASSPEWRRRSRWSVASVARCRAR